MLHQLWPVNVWVENVDCSDGENQNLLNAVTPHIDKYNGVPEIFNKTVQIPNLFLENDTSIQDLRALFKDRLRCLMSAEGFLDVESVDVEVNAFPRRFLKGDRARPHTHRSIDYVGVYYIDLDVVDEGGDTNDRDDGRLLLIDPIAQRSRGLNHNMLVQIVPRPKLLVIHPAYLFHESEMYKGDRERILIVMNARVRDRQQANSFIPL